MMRSVSGMPFLRLRARAHGLHVPRWSSRVPDGTRNDCNFVVTSVPGTNGKRLRVRCTCMAQCNMAHPYSFFAYDHIADVDSIRAARHVWETHVADKRGEARAA